MARKVNTKFVIGLSVALCSAGALYAGIRIRSWMQHRDPEFFKALAEEDLKAGKRMEAARDLYQAADLTRINHQSGADEIFSRAATLFMEVSKDAQTQEDALQAYNLGNQARKQALLENPRNKQVNAELLEDDYKDAQVYGSVAQWAEVESVATSLIKTSDSSTPRRYRAEARLQKVLLSATGNKPAMPDAFAGVDEDIAAALKMDPESGPVVALAANVMQAKALQAALRAGLRANKDFLGDKEGFRKESAAAQAYLQAFLEKHKGQPDVCFQMARLLRQRYDLVGRVDDNGVAETKTLDQIISYGEQAVAGDPGNIVDNGRADFLVDNYLIAKNPEKAQGVYKDMIARAPEMPIGYFALAILYGRQGDVTKAIESYKDVTRHPKIGIERDALRNTYFQTRSQEMVAWLNMDLVEQNTGAEQNAVRMKEAAEFTDKLRTSHASRGIIDLLDGRAQYLNRLYPQAVATLRRAESNLSTNRQLVEDYRRTELTLYRVNLAQGQLGGALDCLEKVLAVNPDDLEVILLKGGLQIRLARYEDARILMEHYLGAPDAQQKRFANQDLLSPAFVEQAVHIWGLAAGATDNQMTGIIVEHDSAYYLQMALKELNSEDYEGAARDAMSVLDKESTNPSAFNQQAYQTAIVAYMLQPKDAEAVKSAKAVADRALLKFPGDPNFQVLKARLENPEAAGTPEGQRKLIEGLSDKYIQQMSFASIYQSEKKWDEAIGSLQKAETLVESASTPDDRDRYAAVINRVFSACLTAAASTKDTAQQEKYYNLAQTYVTKAEKLNQDGTGGMLYRGQLELTRSQGKNGLDYLRQAVAAHPDYAVAHLALAQAYRNIAILNAAQAKAGSAAADTVTSNKNAALEEFRQVLRLAPNNLQAIQFAIELLVGDGNPNNLKEAQQLVESGLRLAPKSAYFLSASEILTGNLKAAIARREEILKKNPEDTSDEAINNRLRLAGLYVRQKDELGIPASIKQSNMANAIAIVNWAHQKNKDNVRLADLLATYLFADELFEDKNTQDPRTFLQRKADYTLARAADALKVYDEYSTNKDDLIRYTALLAKGEFLHRAQFPTGVYDALVKANLATAGDPRSEAVNILLEASKLQPADSDEADRHLGDLYFDIGRIPDAIAVYAKVLAKEKVPAIRDRVERRSIEAELRLDIPERLEDRTSLNDALRKLEAIIKKDPRDTQALVLRAFANLQQFKVEKDSTKGKQLLAGAMDSLNKALAVDAGDPDALYYRAMTTVQMGGEHMDDAIRDLVLSTKRDRSSVKAQMLLAAIYRRSQRYEEASVEYLEVLDAHPELLTVRIDYADFLMSVARQLHTLPADSSEDFVVSIRRLDPEAKLGDLVKRSSEMYPNQPKWPFMYAQLLDMSGKSDQALRIFEALYKAVPGEASIVDAYFGALGKAGNFTRVIDESTPVVEANTKFIAEHPEWAVLYMRRAAAYQQQGKQKEFASDLDHALAVSADAAKAKNYTPFLIVLAQGVDVLSGSSGDEGRLAAAQHDMADRLAARVAADPNEVISRVGLMQMQLLLKQPNEALKVAQSTKVPGDDVQLKSLVLRQLALVKYQAGQYADSEKDFQTLIDLSPKDIESLNNYAFMLADAMNQAPKAIEVANRAIHVLNTESTESQVTSAYASLYDTLGWAKLKANDAEGAIGALLHSVQTQPSSDAYFHLAKAYQKAGKIIEAQKRCEDGIKFATKRKDPVLVSLMDLQGTLNKP